MKKFLSFVLCICLLTSAAAVYALAPGTAAPDGAYLLQYLKITDVKNEENYWSENVTRKEFTQAVYNIVKSADKAKSGNAYYTDIKESDPLFEAAGFLAETKILTVTDDRKFNPESLITYDEAVKMLVTLAGYAPYAMSKGAYPTGYILAAQNLKITSGLTLGGSLDRYAAASLIYNTLSVRMYDVEFIKEGTVNYTSSDTETVLERYFDIYAVEGVVTKQDMTDISSEDGDVPGVIALDGFEYTDETKNQYLLGYEVKAYVKKNGTGRGSVVFAEISEQCKTLEINADDLVDVKIDKITYTDKNGKEKSAKLKNAAFVKNGTLLSSDISKKAFIEKGSLRLVSNDANAYTTVIITEYTVICAGLIDAGAKRVYDKYDPKQYVELDRVKYDKVSVILNGAEANFSSICEGDVLTVMCSEDKNSVVCFISTDKITGTLEALGSDDTVFIDGEQYTLDKKLAQRFNLNILDTAEFIFDKTGEIAEVKNAKNAKYKTGYVYEFDNDENKNRTPILSIFTIEGKYEKLRCADKFSVNNGKKTSEADDLFNVLCKADDKTVLKPQLIRYSVNKDGEITAVNTANFADSMSESQYIDKILDEGKYKFFSSLVYPKTPISAQTVYMKVPSDTLIEKGVTDSRYFQIIEKKTIKTDRAYVFEAYKLNNDSPYADVLIYKSGVGTELNSYDPYAMVRRIYKSVDGYGGETKVLEVFEKGKAVKYYTGDMCEWPKEDVLEGDVIRFATDTDGSVNTIKVICRPSDKSYPLPPSMNTTAYAAAGRLTCHYAYDKWEGNEMDAGGLLSVMMLSDTFGGDTSFALAYSRLKNVMIYDGTQPKGKRVYLGSIDNVVTYKGSGGTGASYVIAHANVGSIENVFVINN